MVRSGALSRLGVSSVPDQTSFQHHGDIALHEKYFVPPALQFTGWLASGRIQQTVADVIRAKPGFERRHRDFPSFFYFSIFSAC
jgi:hypothetical protein